MAECLAIAIRDTIRMPQMILSAIWKSSIASVLLGWGKFYVFSDCHLTTEALLFSHMAHESRNRKTSNCSLPHNTSCPLDDLAAFANHWTMGTSQIVQEAQQWALGTWHHHPAEWPEKKSHTVRQESVSELREWSLGESAAGGGKPVHDVVCWRCSGVELGTKALIRGSSMHSQWPLNRSWSDLEWRGKCWESKIQRMSAWMPMKLSLGQNSTFWAIFGQNLRRRCALLKKGGNTYSGALIITGVFNLILKNLWVRSHKSPTYGINKNPIFCNSYKETE